MGQGYMARVLGWGTWLGYGAGVLGWSFFLQYQLNASFLAS